MPPRDDIPHIPPPTGPGVVNGTDGNDSIFGDYVDADGDQLQAGGSVVDGGAGDDYISDHRDDDTLWGGAGDDTLSVYSGDNTLIGGAGDDVFYADSGNNLIIGDSLDGDLGGNSPSDAAEPDFGDDHMYTGNGNDTFFGGSGDDTVYVGVDIGDMVFVGGETGEDRGDVINGGWHESMSLLITGDEEGIITQGDGSITYSEVEEINLSYKDDIAVIGASSTGKISGWDGYDTLVIPDPEPGETAPVVTVTGISRTPGKPDAQSGYIDFSDGKRLHFDSFQEIICFAAGTLIDTDQGPIRVETLTPGDRVLTRDHGYQPLIWTGRRDLSAADLAACPGAAPIRIAKGAMGAGLPTRDLLVSPRHRMLITGQNVALMFDAPEVLVAAEDLLGLPGVTRAPQQPVSYVHLLCTAHHILQAEGAWSESLQPTTGVLAALDPVTRADLLRCCPDLASHAVQRRYGAARPVLNAAEAQALCTTRRPADAHRLQPA